jgi:hypothetical protein
MAMPPPPKFTGAPTLAPTAAPTALPTTAPTAVAPALPASPSLAATLSPPGLCGTAGQLPCPGERLPDSATSLLFGVHYPHATAAEEAEAKAGGFDAPVLTSARAPTPPPTPAPTVPPTPIAGLCDTVQVLG